MNNSAIPKKNGKGISIFHVYYRRIERIRDLKKCFFNQSNFFNFIKTFYIMCFLNKKSVV